MKDITRAFERWCKLNGISYHYGQRANLNLLQTELPENQVYFLHSDNRRRYSFGQNMGAHTGTNFVGSFFLVVRSDMDMPYYKEVEQENCENKYEKNIEPLLDIASSFSSFFYCEGFSITNFEVIDVTDLLDFNMDGLVINYGISI